MWPYHHDDENYYLLAPKLSLAISKTFEKDASSLCATLAMECLEVAQARQGLPYFMEEKNPFLEVTPAKG